MTTYPEEFKDDLESPFGTSSGTDVRITLLIETTHMMNNLLIANLMKKVLSIKMSYRLSMNTHECTAHVQKALL
jgi:hypothetical protein